MSHPGAFVTFPVSGGIFGVGRLASRLKTLTAAKEIGDWHLGLWVDWRHTAISVDFGNAADAALTERLCSDAGQWPRSALSGAAAGGRAP